MNSVFKCCFLAEVTRQAMGHCVKVGARIACDAGDRNQKKREHATSGEDTASQETRVKSEALNPKMMIQWIWFTNEKTIQNGGEIDAFPEVEGKFAGNPNTWSKTSQCDRCSMIFPFESMVGDIPMSDA